MRRAGIAAAAVVVALGLAGGNARGAISFQGLGIPYGDNSQAYAVSADGSVVVGASGGQAYRWSRTGVFQLLGDLPGGILGSIAYGVSGDGSVVVGYGTATGQRQQAFRWTTQDGMVPLPEFGDTTSSIAYDVSNDGRVIVGGVGSLQSGKSLAVAWESQGGIVNLGDLPSGSGSAAYAASGDGSVVVGTSTQFFSLSTASHNIFRWTQASGMQQLNSGDPPNTTYTVGGISGDGSVVAVWRQFPFTGFIWKSDGNTVTLPDHGIQGISADASIVAGQSLTGAYFWTEGTGIVDLKSFLEQHTGTDLSGWDLGDVGGISADGSTIVGWGTDPFGFQEAWVAVIPEPVTLLLGLGAIGGLSLRIRRRS